MQALTPLTVDDCQDHTRTLCGSGHGLYIHPDGCSICCMMDVVWSGIMHGWWGFAGIMFGCACLRHPIPHPSEPSPHSLGPFWYQGKETYLLEFDIAASVLGEQLVEWRPLVNAGLVEIVRSTMCCEGQKEGPGGPCSVACARAPIVHLAPLCELLPELLLGPIEIMSCDCCACRIWKRKSRWWELHRLQWKTG